MAGSYEREIEAMAKFSHENYVHCFVRFFGWYETEDSLFITMEYLEHGDLQKYLTSSPFPETEAKQIAVQLAEGLDYLHKNNFAHRDLKPPNILVVQPRPTWWVKISDFGISKRDNANTALRTHIGTPGFIAPEVIGMSPLSDIQEGPEQQQRAYSPSVDMWALGAIIVQMLARCSLFPTPADLFKYVVHELPFPRQAFGNDNISEECYNFLERAMAPSSSSRLKASEALIHPWLKTSRPPSIASFSDDNSDAFNGLPLIKPPTFDGAGINGVATEASLAWSTLNAPNTAIQLNTDNPELAGETTQVSPATNTTISNSGAATEGSLAWSTVSTPSITVHPNTDKPDESETTKVINQILLAIHTTISNHNPATKASFASSPVSASDAAVPPHTDKPIESGNNNPFKRPRKENRLPEKEGRRLRKQEEIAMASIANDMDQMAIKDSIAPTTPQNAPLPEVLARLSFKNIEDLCSDILAVARKIYIDVEVVEKQRAAQDLNRGPIHHIQNIDDDTTADYIKSAVANGATLTAKNWRNAVRYNNHECLIALLQCGANPNATVHNLEPKPEETRRETLPVTVLTYAASFENEFAVWALVCAGARVNSDDATAAPTPLAEALYHRHVNLVRFLLANGANANSESCVYSAGIPAGPPMSVLLLTHPPEEFDDKTRAIKHQRKCLKLADLLLQYGARLDETVFSKPVYFHGDIDINRNLFHFAAWCGYADILTWVARNVREINIKWHRTSLYCAAMRNNLDCFEVLKMPPYKDPKGLHHLIVACLKNRDEGTIEVSQADRSAPVPPWISYIEKLIEAGYDPKEKIYFQYRKRSTRRSSGRYVSEEISALELAENIHSKVNRTRLREVLRNTPDKM